MAGALRIPHIRDGKFSTELFQRYQRNEQALVLTLMEMVVNGVATRKIARITEGLCGTEFSASTVSNLCKRLDPIVKGWNEHNLDGQAFPFVLVDAIVIKIREDGRVRPYSVLIAIGINELGHREILGMQIGNIILGALRNGTPCILYFYKGESTHYVVARGYVRYKKMDGSIHEKFYINDPSTYINYDTIGDYYGNGWMMGSIKVYE